MTTKQSEQATVPQTRSQPIIGLLGMVWVGVVFVVLGILPGLERSMVVLGPITLFALPILGASAFYWNGWPGSRFSQPTSGIINTLLIGIGGLLFTVGAQLVVRPSEINGIFSGLESTTWPWTLPLGVLMFWAVLQLTLVSGKWPIHKLNPIPQGFAMLIYVWIVGLIGHEILANWDAFPDVVGLRNPGGSWNGIELIGLIVMMIAWNVVLFFLLEGWPFTTIRNNVSRLVISNAVPILGGWMSYLLLTGPAFSLEIPQVGAIGACVVFGAFTVGLLFESWPMANDTATAKRIGQLIGTALVAAAAYFLLRALAGSLETFANNPTELWVAIAAFNYLAAVVVLYCLTWERWPVRPAESESP